MKQSVMKTVTVVALLLVVCLSACVIMTSADRQGYLNCLARSLCNAIADQTRRNGCDRNCMNANGYWG